MSGTSVDAIDAAVVGITHVEDVLQLCLLGYVEAPIDEHLRQRIHTLFSPEHSRVDETCEVNVLLGEAFAVAADVRKPEEVEKAIAAAVERFGKIDIVVNGAAGNFLCAAEDLSPNGFGAVVDIDLKGTFNVCRAAFDELKKNRGQILNISATLHYLGTPMQLHVSAAKAGVVGLAKWLPLAVFALPAGALE